MKTYDEFLRSKITLAKSQTDGWDDIDLHPSLKDHQGAKARWALNNGRGLIAASFGLGKSRVQCEIARQLFLRFNRPFLLVCPLGVKHHFVEVDGPAMGMEWQYVRTDEEIEAAQTPFLITNYERVRDGDIDPRKHDLCGASLDEGSVLRSFASKTYQTFQELFAHIDYKFVCTATPSPNKTRELIYYAQFLGVMDTGQALTRFFQRNPDKAGDLQLHPQHAESFWRWVASWALFLYYPSDIGFSDEGYQLPEMRVHWHCVSVDQSRAFKMEDNRGQRNLILDVASNDIRNDARERRETLDARLAKVKEILAGEPDRHCLIWHHLEDERRAIEKEIPEAVTVYGSQDLETREQRIVDFSHGRFKYLATKPEIAGSGCNFQRHCSMNIFLGVDYKFEDFIQAVHRTHRFLQTEVVDVHIVYAETQQGIVRVLKQKWAQHIELSNTMREIVREFGLSHEALKNDLKRSIGVQREEIKGERFAAVNNDCVDEVARLADNSVDFIHTSIPFGNHYEYTTNYEDFGHNPSDEHFFVQMDFLIPELLRVLKPGRVAAIHVKDRILYGYQTPHGFMETSPFSDETVMAFKKHGWIYGGRITVVTDVVRENNSSYRLGYTEMCKDGTKMSCGLPEYVLLFRKPPTDNSKMYADEPVVHSKDDYLLARWQLDAHSFWRSDGRTVKNIEPYDFEAHVARMDAKARRGELSKEFLSDPPQSGSDMVWDDVIFMRCLNARQVSSKKIKHVCPLPLDIIQRVVERFTNPGDLVLEPFAGIFSTVYQSVLMGRRGYGIELNSDYYRDGVSYCRAAEIKAMSPALFEAEEIEPAKLAEVEVPA
jgi:DNA modification methylase